MSILQRNKKKATAIGIAAAAVAAIAIGGGTYAAFTATGTGPGGTLASGHMSVSVTNPSASTTLFSASGIAPGYNSGVKTFTITNTGDVDGTLKGAFTVSGGSQLASQLQISGDCGPGFGIPANTTVAAFAGLSSSFPGLPLAHGADLTCKFTFTFPNLADDINNAAQGQSVSIGSTFTLRQP